MVHRLYRSRQDRLVAGVCGGIAEFFQVDAIWIRLAGLLLTLLSGVGLVLYVAVWILVPDNPKQKASKPTLVEQTLQDISAQYSTRKASRMRIVVGVVLILVGILFMVDKINGWFEWHLYWPLLILALGVALLLKKQEK